MALLVSRVQIETAIWSHHQPRRKSRTEANRSPWGEARRPGKKVFRNGASPPRILVCAKVVYTSAIVFAADCGGLWLLAALSIACQISSGGVSSSGVRSVRKFPGPEIRRADLDALSDFPRGITPPSNRLGESSVELLEGDRGFFRLGRQR